MLAEGSGSWLSHIEFDGKLIWKLGDQYEKWMIPKDAGKDEYFLPSDSEYRGDHKCLKVKDYENAEIHKQDMEN